MKKISTFFKKDPNDLGRVIDEISPENMWVLEEGVRATQKFDGTACAIINGVLYKRYDAKKGKIPPPNAIPCQDADTITGHHPHWIPVTEQDKYHLEAFNRHTKWDDGTYELIGPKINGNKEQLIYHILVKHGEISFDIDDLSYRGLKSYLENMQIEGIVFHHPSGKMCKIRRKDFGLQW